MLGNVLTGPLQHWFIMRPKKSRPETKYHFPDLFREVFLESGPGTKFHSLWFQTKNRPPRGVVLYLHGNAGSLERWGEIGPRFTQLGFDILIPDYRGYGKSTGPQSEKAFYQDADSCWKFLEENYPKVPKIIFGRSIGSGPACWLAAHTNPNGLILETPFPSMKNYFIPIIHFCPGCFFSDSHFQI